MSAKNETAILRAIDKKDRLGLFGVYNLLTDGRLDESGDFTPGAGLSTADALWWILYLTHASHDPHDQIVAKRLKNLWKLGLD